MSRFDKQLVVNLIQKGVAPEVAVAAAAQASGHAGLQGLRVEWIVPIDNLESVPDPACVALELEGIDNPTEEDIQRALAKCSR